MTSNAVTPQERLRDAIAGTPILSFLEPVMKALPGLEWYVVGGAVRDVLLDRGIPADIDLVARNIPIDDLTAVLARRGKVDIVGKAFGVIKFMPIGSFSHVDIALPRTELSRGTGGRRDFDVCSDEEISIQDDLSRRDFTVNAMAWNVGTGELIDPYGGTDDFSARRIRAVGRAEDRFNEDLSRMVRGIRFACQLGFDIEERTWDAIVRLAPRVNDAYQADGRDASERIVPYETVSKELVKAIAADPVRAIDLFEKSGLLFRIIPELADMARSTMCHEHHGGRDVWTHAKDALSQLFTDGFKERFPGDVPDAGTALAVALHDIGKPSTRVLHDDGDITNYGHDVKGAKMVEAIARRLRLSSVPGGVIDGAEIVWLVRMHLLPNMVDLDAVKNTTLHRHFLADVRRGRKLLHVAYADAMASRPQSGTVDLSNLDALMKKLDELSEMLKGESQPEKLLSGEEVMEMTGLSSGPEVGRVLDALKEAQLQGQVETHDDAVRFIRDM